MKSEENLSLITLVFLLFYSVLLSLSNNSSYLVNLGEHKKP